MIGKQKIELKEKIGNLKKEGHDKDFSHGCTDSIMLCQ